MAYIAATPFVPQFVDSTGAPLVGGTVYFYVTQTTAPTNIYSDSAGTSLGSSVTLNARGEPQNGIGTAVQLFYDSTVTYKIIVHDADAVAVGPTIDPFNVRDAYLSVSGTKAIEAVATGARVYDTSGDDPRQTFTQDDLSTNNGYVEFHATTGVNIRNEVHGTPVELSGEDANGDAQTIFKGDPDDYSSMYDNGTEVIRTAAAADGGALINNTSTGAGFERAATASDIAAVPTITTGSFTASYTGFTTTPTADVYWMKETWATFERVSLQFVGFSATSNANTFAISNWPAALNTGEGAHLIPYMLDNGTIVFAALLASTGQFIYVDPTTSEMTLSGWTTSGTKGIYVGTSCVSYTYAI